MGNVNEKNTSTDKEKEVQGSLLEPVKNPDPWTDETEEQAVEMALLNGIETHQPSSSSPKRFQQGLFNGHDASSYEPAAVQGENSNLQMKNEICGETGNISLPLSESIIPETFEAFITSVSPPAVFPPFASQVDVPMSLTSDAHSLESVEELTKHTTSLNIGDHPSPEPLSASSPEPFDEFQTGQTSKISVAIAPRSVASDCAAAITERVFECPPPALASNSLLITPHQINDIPIMPLPPPIVKPMGESTAILSPLVLGLSTLVDLGGMELPCQSETESRRDNKSPSLTGVPLKELISFEDTTLGNIPKPVSPHVTPFAPRRKTVPLPPLSAEDSANLFVSEIPSLESSSLVLKTHQPAPSVAHFSPATLHIPGGVTESNQSLIKALSPSIPSIGSASEPLATLDSQFKARPSVQASAVEDEPELLRAAISILNLDAQDNNNTRSTCQATWHAELLPHSSKEAQAVTPEANSQMHSLAMPNMKTYADATDIAMKYPELAKIVLQAPLASQCPSTTIDQHSQKVEDREAVIHFQGLPYWVEGSVEEDIGLISSRMAPSSGSESGCGHTPNTPNWAIAPVLNSTSPLRSSKSQRGRGRRRTKKTKIGQGNGSYLEDSRLIYKPLKLSKATPSVSLELVKEEPPQSISPPHDQLISSEELQKIALTNRQKVNRRTSESASVIWSPKSGATRGHHTMASCSASLMTSELEKVSDGLLRMVGGDSTKKANLPPASRAVEALAARENPEMGLNDRVPVEDGHCSKRTAGSIPTLANALARGLVSSEEDWKVNSSKGKKFSARSSTPSTCRSRSASIASSLASGSPTKLGVSTSTRLFQRAIERIGSRNSSRPIYRIPDSVSVTCHILSDKQHTEPRGIFNPTAQAPDPSSRKSSLLDSSMPINAVTGAERTINRDAASRVKGKVEAVTSSHQMVESSNHAGISDERFSFTLKTPQASIGDDDQNAYMSSQSYTGSLLKTPVEASAVQAPRSQREGKTPRPPSSKTFMTMGRYVSPPVRDNEMLRHDQTSATIRDNVMTGTSAPNQRTKVPRLLWPRVDTNATTMVTTTPGMTVHAPLHCSSDDVPIAKLNEVRNDVMPDVGMHFAAGNGPSAGVRRILEEKYGIVGQYGQLNSGSSVATVPHIAATVHLNPSGSDVRSHGSMTPLDLPEVDQKLGIPGPQIQTDAPASQQQLNEYMAKLSLAQKRIQANMDDIMKISTSSCGEAVTFDSIMATEPEQASSASSGPVAMKTTRFSVPRPLTSVDPQPRREKASAQYPNMPPRFQARMSSDHSVATHGVLPRSWTQPSTQNTDQYMFEEFSRRQRQETRIVNENIPSRLPRRKI